MRHYMRDVFSGLPDTALDWGGCIIFLWLFSFWPSWQLGLLFICVGIAGVFVRAMIRAYRARRQPI